MLGCSITAVIKKRPQAGHVIRVFGTLGSVVYVVSSIH
jgi:hypothetical protein